MANTPEKGGELVNEPWVISMYAVALDLHEE
jgi:hypothetical protein